jgi:hypothetical protein
VSTTVLVTPLPPEECAERLQAAIDSSWWDISFGSKPVKGWATASSTRAGIAVEFRFIGAQEIGASAYFFIQFSQKTVKLMSKRSPMVRFVNSQECTFFNPPEPQSPTKRTKKFRAQVLVGIRENARSA